MTPDQVVRAFDELRALMDEGEGENSGLDAAATREGIDLAAVENAIEAMLWNDLRTADPEASDEHAQSIADFRADTNEQVDVMAQSFLAGVRAARQHKTAE